MATAKRSLMWVIFHTAAIVFVFINLATGLRIAILTKPELSWLSALLPQGELHTLHIAVGCGLTALALAYLLQRWLKPDKRNSPRARAKNYHYWITWYGYLVIILTMFSGWLLLSDQNNRVANVDLHFYAALAFITYLFLHGGAYFTEYGISALKRIILPGCEKRTGHVLWIVLTLSGGIGLWYALGQKPQTPLEVFPVNISDLITIDGNANEPVWQQVEGLKVHTRGGANFMNGATDVTIKAIENGVELFLHVSWDDPTHSIRHLPLLKTEHGWQVQQNGFHQFDEVEFYEDKFALLLSQSCEAGGDGTMHLGPNPLADKPGNWHGKGYHYADDGIVRDLWHWKAVRTNDMFLADDNFIAAPAYAHPGERRYTAGYLPDGKESGAYVMNWQWYKRDTIVPKRIPKDMALLAPFQSAATENSLNWVIPWFDYESYHADQDTFPVGTLMPSVMYRSNRFEGDRADVRAHALWREGKWSMELSRRLNTGSRYDVALHSGVCLWVSAFDRSQIAHTRHQQAIRLEFQRHD
ncbi:MAG: ethylbenzene dehydrogenase-related protein [Saccharospirillaceae bacterium]|nr:ethylbenzene dehydrogenase-related protein [Saccharospirillaceae bacterium]MCD8531692.1 ethylbenzene dehydrogenase-related protein [Saccharospirillaceae bacterium]